MVPKYSVVTSLNGTIYRSNYQILLEHLRKELDSIPVFLYHENSLDLSLGNPQVEIADDWPMLTQFDLFDCWDATGFPKNWLNEFLFGDCSPWKRTDPNHYWQRNSFHWFRKIAAIYHCFSLIKSECLIWLDCDLSFKRLPDEQFFGWTEDYDICSIKRYGHPGGADATETGLVLYRNNRIVNDFLSYYLWYYINLDAFTHRRWDDCNIFDVVCSKPIGRFLRLGFFGNDHLPESVNDVSPFNIYEDYIFHYKRDLKDDREASAEGTSPW